MTASPSPTGVSTVPSTALVTWAPFSSNMCGAGGGIDDDDDDVEEGPASFAFVERDMRGCRPLSSKFEASPVPVSSFAALPAPANPCSPGRKVVGMNKIRRARNLRSYTQSDRQPAQANFTRLLEPTVGVVSPSLRSFQFLLYTLDNLSPFNTDPQWSTTSLRRSLSPLPTSTWVRTSLRVSELFRLYDRGGDLQ